MATSPKAMPRWRWRRWIPAGSEDLWLARLAWMDLQRLTFSSRPNAARLRLEIFGDDAAEKKRLLAEAGGTAEAMRASWMVAPYRVEPLRVSDTLYVVDDPAKVTPCEAAHPGARALCVPADIAFGTGEHETTGMAMRELARRGVAGRRVLDAGTGSGLLALVARQLGAAAVTAFDFDPDCIRVAKANERANFAKPSIDWSLGDIAKWPKRLRHDVVLANLYSELLITHAKRLAALTAPGGLLLATGIFVDQEGRVARALREAGLRQLLRRRRGRWVLLLCEQPA